MKVLNLEVDGMSCGGCVKKITNYFEGDNRIDSISVSLENKLVEIKCSDEVLNMDIRNEITDLGFTVNKIKKM